MNKKLIWIFSTVVIIALIIGGFFLLNSNKTPEVNVDAASVALPKDVSSKDLSGTVYITPILHNATNIKMVELFIDDVMVHVSYSAPFKLTLDTSQLKNGTHSMYLKATDTDDGVITSKAAIITIENKKEDDVSVVTTPTTAETGQGTVKTTTPKKSTTTKSTNPPTTPTAPVVDDPETPPIDDPDEPEQPAGDTQRPTTVTGLAVSAPSNTSAHFTWNATQDNVAVTEYKVYRSGVLVATLDDEDALVFDDSAVVPGNYYTYSVTAGDAAGNTSLTSLRIAITMPFASPLTGTTDVPLDSGDDGGLNLGMKFIAKTDGLITGVRFYKLPGNTGYHTATLWAADRSKLRVAEFPNETASGWQVGTFNVPFRVTAGTTYSVSYHTPTSHYAYTPNAFSGVQPTNPYIEALQSTSDSKNGIYKYSPYEEYPQDETNGTSYWVDPTFVPFDTVNNATTDSLNTIPWEGGPSYYEQFAKTNGTWTDPTFFPVGVWFEAVTEQSQIDADKSFGINTYVELTSNSDMALVDSNGMNAIISYRAGAGNETKGFVSLDEADMYFGPGNGAWDRANFRCTVNNVTCGYTAMAEMKALHPAGDGRFDYANYGKGVTMWEGPALAAGFVNGYTTVTSADMYFYTDSNLCPGEAGAYLGIPANLCQRSANYGMILDKMRALDALDNIRQPIFGFVEDGHPFTDAEATTITPNQLAGAVYSSLIHEARGIIYFNHNYGGTCAGNQHSMRDACYPATNVKITQVNQQIKDLAPVLNTQSLSYLASKDLDTMLKKYNGSYYLFAMTSLTTPTGSHTLRLPANLANASVEVLFENRTRPVTNGTFTDTFAEESTYHVYKITP